MRPCRNFNLALGQGNAGPCLLELETKGAPIPSDVSNENAARARPAAGSNPLVPTPLPPGTYLPRHPASWVPRGLGHYPGGAGYLER